MKTGIGRLDFALVGLTIDEVAKSKSGRERFENFLFYWMVAF